MTDMQVFVFEETSEIRTLQISGEPWFVATDICRALDLSNPTMAVARLDEDERSKFNLGRQGMTNCVNEFGLYNLILASRKPEARRFKRWVTHEVLPQIRQTGGYIPTDDADSPADIMAKALIIANKTLEQKNKRISELEPKAMFADAVSASSNSILVADLAKLLKQNGHNTGQNRLFSWLRENDYLIKRKGADYNSPTQRSMEMGLFEIKETIIYSPDKEPITKRTPKVTGKGQVYFLDLFANTAADDTHMN